MRKVIIQITPFTAWKEIYDLHISSGVRGCCLADKIDNSLFVFLSQVYTTQNLGRQTHFNLICDVGGHTRICQYHNASTILQIPSRRL